jgi:hypothetical protein
MFREMADEAERRNMTVSDFFRELEKRLGPLPMPPKGYTLASGVTDIWVGEETYAHGWIITPTWNATTYEHGVELWLATNPDESYSQLTPEAALKLSRELTETVAKIGVLK